MTSSGHPSLAESASSSALRELGNASSRRRATIPPSMADTDESFRRTPHQPVGHMRLFVNGFSADVSLDSDGLRWSPCFEDDGGGLGAATTPPPTNTFGNGQGLFFCFPMLEASAINTVLFKEMLCVERLVEHRNSGVFQFFNFLQDALTSSSGASAATNSTDGGGKSLLYGFSVYTFRRNPSKPSEWHPWQLAIESENEALIETLQARISDGILTAATSTSSSSSSSRPHRLLLILNPNSGIGAARAHYRNILQPLLAKAGISTQVVETERAGHAKQIVLDALLPPPTELGEINDTTTNHQQQNQQLQRLEYDGIVAVGGDGIFHEVLNGLLEAQKQAFPSLLSSLRLAHIPCGSTDAVACSLHGCRSVFTAAMHMVLGDSTPLDALKVSINGKVRYACCIATYGFMGDVVQESEKHRWLGPLRYDIIGAMKIVHNQSYACRVSYLPASSASTAGAGNEEGNLEEEVKSVCVTNCSICRAASLASSSSKSQQDLYKGEATDRNTSRPTSSHPTTTSTTTAVLDNEGYQNNVDSNAPWRVVEGEWMSIMMIVQPCRSDKTPHGMARYGHLNDGRFTLVLVRRCSPLNYLRFLATMSSSGLAPGLMPGVLEVIDAVACKVESIGGTGNEVTSHWNIDGEIVQGLDMEAHAQLGAVQCFARGVET